MDHRARPPKTPLKRLSRNSLRSQTLSSSFKPLASSSSSAQTDLPDHLNHPQSQPPQHLQSISHLFSDLADSFTDLNVNLSNLDLVCQDLDGFNHAFSSFVYGLRMNAYLTQFEQAPKLNSFKFFHQFLDQQHKQHQEEREKKIQQEQQVEKDKKIGGPESFADRSQQDASFSKNEPINLNDSSSNLQPSTSSSSNLKSKDSSNIKSSLSLSSKTKHPNNFTNSNKSQQKQLLKYCQTIIEGLPLKFREQQPNRTEMEYVISCLKLNFNSHLGLSLKDLVKLEPSLALHRVRECCTALVNAKKAVKINHEAGMRFKLII